jgi:DNA-binding NtrC family response regulator/tetratricopeptide (TPR) repeat protein
VNQLTELQSLYRAGRFADALVVSERSVAPFADRLACDVIKVELLERVGRYAESRTLADKLSRNRALTGSQQSACHFTLGLLSWDEGRADEAMQHFQKAVSLAQAADDLFRVCWAQLRLWVVSTGRSGPQASLPLLARTRSDVLRLGDPLVSATLHVLVGEIEAKQGALQTARRHTVLGQRLLVKSPNLWLRAIAENTLTAISFIESDFESGMVHAKTALEAAELSGAAAATRACLGNLGNLYYLAGDLEQATDYLKRAAAILPVDGEYTNGTLESLAKIYLLKGRLDAARGCLDAIDSTIETNSDRLLYPNRHAQLTRAILLRRESSPDAALRQVDVVARLASESGDRLLANLAHLHRTEILAGGSRLDRFAESLNTVVPSLPGLPLELHGQYERALACAHRARGDVERGVQHFTRATRIFERLRSTPAQLELSEAWSASANEGEVPSTPLSSNGQKESRSVLQDAAALLLHCGKPELLAGGIVEILAGTDSIIRAVALARGADGTVEMLAAHTGADGDDSNALPQQTYSLGTFRGRVVEVLCQPRFEIEAIATVNAVTMLVEVIRELERGRLEREERLTLWPLEEFPGDGDEAVIAGRMREVMNLARRVAPTSASVMLTGESGTGKEIVARAIHRHSNRSSRPFVPFNCTAVPKDLLESQLFGYRRGAFTGAERDHPGLIRAAQGGTLFLDEVGELGLDLQPKLLRFLESGEINPLGEPQSLTVSVRVIAATNADLERLVQEGRFREDLFYRLNVIPLTIPPLRERRDEIPMLVHHFIARAAAEYGKGRIRVKEETLAHLGLYSWPGNIRQLNNEIRRAVAVAEPDSVLTAAALSPYILEVTRNAPRGNGGPELKVPLTDKLNATLDHVEHEMIKLALHTHNGRVDDTARALGISRKGLYLKRQRFGL